MNKYLPTLVIAAVLSACTGQQQPSAQEDRKAILSILYAQQEAWNKGDLDKFMIGYMESDSLMFIGSGGIVHGYENTLERYRKRYSSRGLMGKLNFTVNELRPITDDVYLMAGAYHLERDSVGNASGVFTLVWKRQEQGWVIAADHTQ